MGHCCESQTSTILTAKRRLSGPISLPKEIPYKEEMSENVEFDKEGLINEIGAVIKELLAEVKSDLDRLDAELKEMKGENTDLKEMAEQLTTENTELQSQVTELSKEPATKPVEVSKFNDTRIPRKPYNAMSSKERFFYNLNK